MWIEKDERAKTRGLFEFKTGNYNIRKYEYDRKQKKKKCFRRLIKRVHLSDAKEIVSDYITAPHRRNEIVKTQ